VTHQTQSPLSHLCPSHHTLRYSRTAVGESRGRVCSRVGVCVLRSTKKTRESKHTSLPVAASAAASVPSWSKFSIPAKVCPLAKGGCLASLLQRAQACWLVFDSRAGGRVHDKFSHAYEHPCSDEKALKQEELEMRTSRPEFLIRGQILP